MKVIKKIFSFASISFLFTCLILGTTGCTKRVEPTSSSIEEKGEWEITKAPTCTEKGIEVLVNPSNPNDVQTRTIPALGHDIIHHEGKASTCTEDGWEAYDTCSRCDYTTYKEITKTGHNFDKWVVDKEATCLEDGLKHSVCSKCGETKNETIPALGHTPSEAVVENKVEATCTVDGHYDSVVYCSVCHVEISRDNVTIPSTGHTSSDWIIDLGATCTTNGSKHRECTLCHEVLETEVILALGHTPSEAEVENKVEATCTVDGHYDSVVYCSVCHVEISRTQMTIDALGHDLVHHDAKAPTCTEIGWDAYDTCSRCDYTTYVEKPALGHNYEGQEVTYTWSEDLSKCIASVECKNCSETLSETVSTSFIITKEPDDENNIPGEKVYTATFTNSLFIEQTKKVEIPANHTHDYSIYLSDETEHWLKCSICGQEQEAKVAHTYDQEVVDGKYLKNGATCTEAALYYKSCICGHASSSETFTHGTALGHTEGEWTIIEEATYDKDGLRRKLCTVCGYILEEETIPALAHEAKVSIDGTEAVVMGATTKGEEDPWKEQYKLTATLTAGQELVFTYNGTVISSDIGPDSGDNNIKLVDGKLLVICDIENADIYFKVWEGGYSVWVTGYQHNIQVYVDEVEELDLGEIAKNDNIAAFTINLRLGQVMTITSNGVALTLGTGTDTEFKASKTGEHTVYVNKYKQIWVTAPNSTTYSVTVNGVETEIVLIPDDTNNAQFKLTLAKDDVVVVYGSGIELLGGSYERTEYKVTKDGEYTFYVNKKDKVYLSVIFYLQPNSNWLVDNARFAANLFGNGDTWVDLIKCGDGTYKLSLTLEQYNTYNGLIFCRMNPNTSTNNWGNKWNQTGDLVLSNADSNLYTIADNTWDKGEGTWSTKK